MTDKAMITLIQIKDKKQVKISLTIIPSEREKKDMIGRARKDSASVAKPLLTTKTTC